MQALMLMLASVAMFSPQNGAIVSFKDNEGVERVKPAAEMFTLSFLDDDGNETRMRSSDFTFVRDGEMFRYARNGGPKVELRVRTEGDELRVKPKVSDWPKGLRLNWIDAPQVCVAEQGRLYWPYWDGVEVSDFTCRTNGWNQYRPVTWVKRFTSGGGIYPGNAQMQFLAHYVEGKGLYFGADDELHTQKGVEWEWIEPGKVRLSLQTYCGDAKDGVYESAFEYRLKPYAGGWMEGCAIYRDWVRGQRAFATPTALPEWAKDSPIVIAYPIKGNGMDNEPSMGPNQYYPYVNALKEIERYSQIFDSRMMALLMHWEGTAPWCPPYVWPPYGGEAELAKFRDALHAKGNLLGLYCSGVSWTQVSCVDPLYTQTAKFADENLGRWMARGPKGEIDASVCNYPNAQRFGFELCLTEDWCRKTLLDEARKMAKFGADYCQFFDQNLGGGTFFCWSRRHRHPSIPGSWGVRAMEKLQADLIDNARAAGSQMTFGCEAAAATPFVKNLFFNDARSFFARGHGRPVPGLAFVFHEWMCNFAGNQCAMRFDPYFRWTYSFHAGDMMTVVMGPEGKLVTAWAVPWSAPRPNQERLIGLVRKFNQLRKRYPQYLLNGKMIVPPVKVECDIAEVEGTKPVLSYPAVLATYWEDAKGNRIGFLSNWRDCEAKARLVKANGESEEMTFAPFETKTDLR